MAVLNKIKNYLYSAEPETVRVVGFFGPSGSNGAGFGITGSAGYFLSGTKVAVGHYRLWPRHTYNQMFFDAPALNLATGSDGGAYRVQLSGAVAASASTYFDVCLFSGTTTLVDLPQDKDNKIFVSYTGKLTSRK